MFSTRLAALRCAVFACVVVSASPVLLHATSDTQLSDAQLVHASPRIVDGNVTGVSSAWNAEHSQIWTTVTIRVTSMIKGAMPSTGVVTLKLLGGQVGDIAADVSDQAHFELGEDVIVFLKDTHNPFFPTTGMAQGKLTVVADPGTGQLMIRERGVSRTSFVRDISRVVRDAEGGR